MFTKEIIIGIIVSAIILAVGFLGINSYINGANADSFSRELADVKAEVYNYKGSSPKIGTFDQITLNGMGYVDIGQQADNYDYEPSRIAYINGADTGIVAAGTTYTAVKFQTDSDGSGVIDSADAVSDAASNSQLIPLESSDGMFFTVIEGDGTNGAKNNHAMVMVGYGVDADGAIAADQTRSKLEAKFHTTPAVTVLNGATNSDGAFVLDIDPNY